MSERGFDYLIVGAGSAGCTLASRLTEDSSVRVLVLEAGAWPGSPWVSIPLGWGKVLEHRLYDWGYDTEPEPQLDGRRIECARGKAVGGSSAINAMAYVRGHSADYDRWAASGLAGWSYADVLPYFRRQETWERGSDRFRGGDGPLHTRMSRYRDHDPVVDAWIEAGRDAGFAFSDDYNGERQEGFSLMQSTIWRGRRVSAADAYLRPALGRKNLSLITGALATRVVFEGCRAVGVEYVRQGVRQVARAHREVLLSGGAINSPQLLMLSGVGDPAELAVHGIDARIALQGVGRNLQDHPSVAVEYRRREPGPFARVMRVDRIAVALARARWLGDGYATDLPSGFMAFLRSDLAGPLPDIQLLFRGVPVRSWPYLPPFRAAFADGFACRAVVLRPESRGRVSLRSADPAAPVRIAQNLLRADADRRAMRAGVRLVQALGRERALAPFVADEIAPGRDAAGDAELDAYVRRSTATAHHPLGTCRMGGDGDAAAVVDRELRVRGVEGLRVVDAAVMPDLVGGNINAAVIMIAEKAADLIRGRTMPAIRPAVAAHEPADAGASRPTHCNASQP